MMKLRLMMAAALVAGSCTRAPASFAGAWVFSMEPDFRGERSTVECQIEQEVTVVRVRCGGGIEMPGRIRGRTATFSTPPMTADRLVAEYTAALSPDGSRLVGTWTLTGGVLNEKGAFTATRRDE